MNNEKVISDFYKLGQLAVKRGERTDGTYGQGAIQQLADLKAVSKEHVYKARTFACSYSKRDMERLCARRSPRGKPLGIGHVYELIQVDDQAERLRLESEAAKRGWSVRDLKRERQRASFDDLEVKRAGRPQRAATSPGDLVMQLEEHITRVRRWITGLSTVNEQGKAVPGKELAGLPLGVRGSVLKLSEQLDEVLFVVQRYKRTKRLLGKRKPSKT